MPGSSFPAAFEVHGFGALLHAAFAAERDLALFAVEHLEGLVRALRLKPIDVAGMIGLFVEALRGVSVEDRPAEGRAFHRVAIAASGAVPAGEDELELPGAGLAEERDGRIAEAGFAAVVLDLLEHGLGVFGRVQAEENLLHHLVLILVEKGGDVVVGDVPVVIDLGAQRVVEGKAERLALILAQRLEERRHERLGRGGGSGGAADERDAADGGRGGEAGGGFQEIAARLAAAIGGEEVHGEEGWRRC